MLVEEFELGMLWDEYGLVGDVVVSSFFSLPFTYVPSLHIPLLVPWSYLLIPDGRYEHHARLRTMSDTFGCLGTDP
jgi:hypothetical protein